MLPQPSRSEPPPSRLGGMATSAVSERVPAFLSDKESEACSPGTGVRTAAPRGVVFRETLLLVTLRGLTATNVERAPTAPLPRGTILFSFFPSWIFWVFYRFSRGLSKRDPARTTAWMFSVRYGRTKTTMPGPGRVPKKNPKEVSKAADKLQLQTPLRFCRFRRCRLRGESVRVFASQDYLASRLFFFNLFGVVRFL